MSTDPLDPAARAIVTEEEEMAARVGRRIAASIAQRSAARAPEQRIRHDTELVALRDQIAEARNEDVAALLAQLMRTAGVAEVGGPKASGTADPDTPYFGHMRLQEGGRARDVLIGKRGMIDREAGVVIVDWRDAPVSRLYYRYDEGDEYEEELGDKVREGTVLARRTVTFRDGRLLRVRSPLGTFARAAADAEWSALAARAVTELRGGVGKAERAPAPGARPSGPRRLGGLGDAHARTDRHLPEIAALIDPQQFNAMTSPDSGVVILQGGAGSGKTTVALHRVAWLTYADPRRFRADRVVVVVAQPQLARYVERLLPSLDVHGVRTFAYQEWVRRAVERVLPFAERDDAKWSGARRKRAGRVLGRRVVEDPPADVSRVKKHPQLIVLARARWRTRVDDMLAALTASVAGRPDEAVVQAAIDTLRGPQPVTVADVDTTFAALRGANLSADVRERIRRIAEPFVETAHDVIAEWEDLITDRRLVEILAAADPAVDAPTVEAFLRYTKRQIEEVPDLSDIDPERRGEIGDEGLDADDPLDAFDACDFALLLTLHIARHGALAPFGGEPLTYEHVVVDEAQDLAAIEIHPLLTATGASKSLTLAGDVVQKVVFDNGYDEWATLETQLGISAQAIEPFKLSYRSTAEVVEFAREVLGPLAPKDPPQAVRNGAPVECFCFADIGEEIAFLADNLRALMGREPQASVALLLRYPERARFYFEMLSRAEVPRLRLVLGPRDEASGTGDDFSFTPGIDVTHVSRVKGLEYDYVVMGEVTEAMYPDHHAARHLLHIGATRAAHQLWLTTQTQAPSPLLPKHLLVDG